MVLNISPKRREATATTEEPEALATAPSLNGADSETPVEQPRRRTRRTAAAAAQAEEAPATTASTDFHFAASWPAASPHPAAPAAVWILTSVYARRDPGSRTGKNRISFTVNAAISGMAEVYCNR